MNPSSLYEMRHSIVQAVSDYVDIEAEELVEVRPCPPALSPAHICNKFASLLPVSPCSLVLLSMHLRCAQQVRCRETRKLWLRNMAGSVET